jgi:hypothetical protein
MRCEQPSQFRGLLDILQVGLVWLGLVAVAVAVACGELAAAARLVASVVPFSAKKKAQQTPLAWQLPHASLVAVSLV